MKALLALESGKVFFGESFGAEGETTGEVVFNTSMAGYQEILTDPSYEGQIITMTSPHIGNYGVNDEDEESRKPFGAGFIVREASGLYSSWRAKESLQAYLQRYGLVGIAGIDTRALTKHLRDAGSQRGVVSTRDLNPDSLIAKAKASPSMNGLDLAKGVTCSKPYHWAREAGRWVRKNIDAAPALEPREQFRVVVMDFGIKYNSLRSLSQRGCQVLVVPAQTKAEDILAYKPHGVLISNGPGDPAAVSYGIKSIQGLIDNTSKSSKEKQTVIMGICLGNQLLGLAMGGKTYKLKFGHRGGNHPVKDLTTGKIEITSQNHGFAVDATSLPQSEVELSHVNLNDQTCEGLRHKKLPIFAVQYHPEASPGPHDASYLFDRFVQHMSERKNA
jgi:carbamoyl-phosphate synthase small subunit